METGESMGVYLLDKHIHRVKKEALISLLITIVPILALLGPVIYFAIKLDDAASIIGLFITVSFLGAFVLFLILQACLAAVHIRNLSKMRNEAQSCPSSSWRLDGDEWTSYVDHVFGPTHDGYRWPYPCLACSWCCCRRRRHRQYYSRQFGYIVVFPFCIIIDELIIVNLKQSTPKGANVVKIHQQQTTVRVSLYSYGSDVPDLYGHIDLFIPRRWSESSNEVLQIINIVNQQTGAR